MKLTDAHRLSLTLTVALAGALLLAAAGGGGACLWLAPAMPLAAWLGKNARVAAACAGRSAWPFALALVALSVLTRESNGALESAAAAGAALVVVRLLFASLPSHDGQALLLLAALACAAAVLESSAWLLPLSLAFVASLTVTLSTRQLLYDVFMLGFAENDAALTSGLSARSDVITGSFLLAMVPLTALLIGTGVLVFVAFPRGGAFGHVGSAGGSGGVPGDVSLGGMGFGRVASGPLVRVSLLDEAAFARGLYLRAQCYEAWVDGRFVAGTSAQPWQTAHVAAGRPRRYELRFAASLSARAPSLGPLVGGHVAAADGQSIVPIKRDYRALQPWAGVGDESLAATGQVRLTLEGALWPTDPSDTGDGASLLPAGPVRPHEREAIAAARTEPSGLDARIAPLAKQLTSGRRTASDKAQAIRAYLLTAGVYATSPASRFAKDPLADFLFGSKEGHCEYYATAFAVLLRLSGVPCRVVGGFAFGDWDREGQVVVFGGSHAHAWVEWWDEARGWRTADATPLARGQVLGPVAALLERWRRAYDDKVVGFGVAEQLTLVDQITRFCAPLRAAIVEVWRTWSWPQMDGLAGVVAFGTALVAGLWLRARSVTAKTSKVARLLEQALVRKLKRPLLAHEPFSLAAQRCGAEGAVAFASAARALIERYEGHRFGPASTASPKEAAGLLRQARALWRMADGSG